MITTDWSAEDATRIRAAAAVWADRDQDGEPYVELYRRWYAAPMSPATTIGWDRRWAPLPRMLRQAHAGSRSWSAPTPVITVGLAGTVVTRDDSGARHAHPRGDYLTITGCPGLEPEVGTPVRTLTRHGGHVAEGWWRTWGGGWRPTSDQQPAESFSRIYLAPRPDRLMILVRRLTAALSGIDGLGWQLKVAADPALLTRPDAVVVYLPDDAVRRFGPIAADLAIGLVADRRPPFTRSLAVGVGWAEDPGDGDSFGENRCRLLATAFAGLDTDDDPTVAAAETFRTAGLDPAAPHLCTRRIPTVATTTDLIGADR